MNTARIREKPVKGFSVIMAYVYGGTWRDEKPKWFLGSNCEVPYCEVP